MNTPDQTTLQNALNEVADDAPLVREIVAALKQSGLKGLTPLLPRIAAEAREDFEAVPPALALAKASYKTTEFWLTTGVLLSNAVFLACAGKPLPLDVNATVAGLVAVYTLVRGALKKDAPTA